MKRIKTFFTVVCAIASLTLAIAVVSVRGELNAARLELKRYQEEAQDQEIRAVVDVLKACKTREEVRARYPAFQWLETKQGETSFMFSATEVGPSWGVLNIVIQGWVESAGDPKVWGRIFTVLLNDVVDVKLSVDPKTGVLSAKDIKDIADDKFKEKTLFTFDLRGAREE